MTAHAACVQRTRARVLASATSLACAVALMGTLSSACHRRRARPSVAAEKPAVPASPPEGPQLDGSAFPDHVLALTWDDGPDVATLDLARYLASEHVSATFFVVSEWREGISSDPGSGSHVFETGASKIPILGDLVALGHRLGNHTLQHPLLWDAPAGVVEDQIGGSDRLLAPYLTNELRVFRVPGGAWGLSTAAAVRGDPALEGLVGPVRWDVDRKDWETSIACQSDRPNVECERAHGVLRTKPSVVGKRYLESIEKAGHGVVLLHDRVGDVGSRYALELAQALVPELREKGYVFAAPVLRFSPLDRRDSPSSPAPFAAGTLVLGDVDGDGYADACGIAPNGFACLRGGVARGPRPSSSALGGAALVPRVAFGTERLFAGRLQARSPAHIALADVDGDGRADACARSADGIECAPNAAGLGFGAWTVWSKRGAAGGGSVTDFSDADGWSLDPSYAETIRFADIDGDHRADVCGRSPLGLVCGRSQGPGFEAARVWLGAMSDENGWRARDASSLRLADVNGDGMADACVLSGERLACALSLKGEFGKLEAWGSWVGRSGSLELADLNGDGRADACAPVPGGIACALSNGKRFLEASLWLSGAFEGAALQLVDVSRDGRADACLMQGGLRCAIAP